MIGEPKSKAQLDRKHALHLTAALLIVIAAATLLLTFINALTADRIAVRKEESRRASLTSVMPSANVFSELYSEDSSIDAITGAYAGTRFLGYCVEVSAHGFGGVLHLMVGVDQSGSVTGVSVLSHSETADLGAEVENADFLEQYVNKSGTITVNTGKNAIDAITGATATSQAVTDAVNTALTAVLNYSMEGGALPDGSEE